MRRDPLAIRIGGVPEEKDSPHKLFRTLSVGCVSESARIEYSIRLGLDQTKSAYLAKTSCPSQVSIQQSAFSGQLKGKHGLLRVAGCTGLAR
jgi:hypothetical protein